MNGACSLPGTPSSTSGHDSHEGDWLELWVQLRSLCTGEILFACKYDPVRATVNWVRGQLCERQLIPPNTFPVLSTVPRLPEREAKTLNDMGKLLREVWDEQSVIEESEDATTVILGVVFVGMHEE